MSQANTLFVWQFLFWFWEDGRNVTNILSLVTLRKIRTDEVNSQVELLTQTDKVEIFQPSSQRPRTDLNKRSLPRPKTTTAWKLIPHRSKISKNRNPPRWVPLYRFFKNWFLLMRNNFTIITFKLILLSKKVPSVEDFKSCWY